MNLNNKTPIPVYRYAFILALAAAFLLLIPLTAMQFSSEVIWSPFDFILAWCLLFGAGMTYKLVIGNTGDTVYRLAAGLAVITALFLIWANLAVGLIGSENNPANAMYLGVLAILFIAAVIARLNAAGMAIALFVTAFSQILVTVIAIIAEFGMPENTPVQLILINGFFVVLWVVSAVLFQYADFKNRTMPKSNISKAEN